MFVPSKYDTLAGINAAPRSNDPAFHVSIIHNGSDGSSIPIPRLPIVIAPKQQPVHLYSALVFIEIRW